MPLISSRTNERIKQLRNLRNRRDRDQSGTFFIEGERLLRAAIETGAVIDLLVLAPDRLTREGRPLVETLAERRVPQLEVTPEVFDSVSFREEAQSVGAVVRQRWETLSLETPPGRRCWVALHDIQHPGNLGTIIRTCDAIGGDGVILSGRTTDPYHPVAVRGSLGAIFSQRLVRATPADFANWVRARREPSSAGAGFHVIGTSPEGRLDFRSADYASRPVVLVMGNEREGISKEQIALCDEVVGIPMDGYVESLNLAVAAGLVLYEVLRQAEAAKGQA